jgi:7-keto-8-aminopelargonate synthetase-like enzyme
MDGELAPLPDLLEIARRWDAVLLVDDAHATGVIGPEGRGTLAHFGIEPDEIVQVGTLSKTLGAQGGFVAGQAALVDLLRNRARSLVYSTALAPAAAGAAGAALRLSAAPEYRRTRLRNNVGRLRARLRQLGYRLHGDTATPIIPLIVGSPEAAVRLSAALEDEGVLVTAIRPPTVPEGTSRIRVTPMATHTPADLEQALSAFQVVSRSAEPPA